MEQEYPTKFYPDFESLKVANAIMNEFQALRNILRKDYENLLEIAASSYNNQLALNFLYRAC